jgi:ribosomal protein S18 acetylase RimI-like enzyme
MIPYIIAGAIGFVIAKALEEDEAPKYDDGGSINNSDYTGNYRDLREFIYSNDLQELFVDIYKKYESELNKDNWEDYTYGELGYDEEIISSIIGKNYKIFYNEENDEFVITKKKLNKINFEITLSTKKYNDKLIKVIEDNGVYTEYKPRYVVLVKENVIGGSTFEIDDNNIYHFDLAIDEEYQGYGIAKKLIDKIVQDAENLKAEQIQAYVVNNMLFEYLKNSGWNVSKDGGEKYAWKQIKTDNFKKGGSVLLAPNGKPSNLTPEQYKLVRTKAFKDWFGDWENDPENASKVVDENGEPLVVYHGTKNSFHEFVSNRLIFSTPNEQVARFFGDYREYFMKLINPFIIKEGYNTWERLDEHWLIEKLGKETFIEMLNNQHRTDFTYESWLEYIEEVEAIPITIDELGYYLKKYFNYDGVIAYNIHETDNHIETDDYIGFEPTQIKLADGSNTTFDGENPDIRFMAGGNVNDDGIRLFEELYHGTSKKRSDEIKSNGFSLSNQGEKSGFGSVNGISLTSDFDVAQEHSDWASEKFNDEGSVLIIKSETLKILSGSKFSSLNSDFEKAFKLYEKGLIDGVELCDYETGDGCEEFEVFIFNTNKLNNLIIK